VRPVRPWLFGWILEPENGDVMNVMLWLSKHLMGFNGIHLMGYNRWLFKTI
jgi:hypothetical protein